MQLIDASNMFVKRRRNIGDKRVDISDLDRHEIVKAYGEFTDAVYQFEGKRLESKIFSNDSFGFVRVSVQTPLMDENNNVVLDKKGKIVFDKTLDDTEDIPLTEDIEDFINREVRPYSPGAVVNEKKNKIGYEIPFSRLFYKFSEPEQSDDIAVRIQALEEDIVTGFERLSGRDVKVD